MAARQYGSVLHLMDPELRIIMENRSKPERLARPTRENIQRLRPAFDASGERWQNHENITHSLGKCQEQTPWTQSMTEIICRDKYCMRAEICRPEGSGLALAVFLLVHGGGLMMGGLGTDRALAQLLCSSLKAVVVSIDYRYLPEISWTVLGDDVYDAMSWIQTEAGKESGPLHDVDLSKGFTACGPSGGGNLVTSALLTAAEKLEEARQSARPPKPEIPIVTGVMMLMTGFPVEGLDTKTGRSIDYHPRLRPSWKGMEEAPIMNRWVNPNYSEVADGFDLCSITFTPFNLPLDSPLLDHLPKRWHHQLAGLDMWHDTALLWLGLVQNGKLEPLQKRSGIHLPSVHGRPVVKVDYYTGLPHTWWSVYPQVSRTRQWLKDLVEGGGWTLNPPESEVHGSCLSPHIAKL